MSNFKHKLIKYHHESRFDNAKDPVTKVLFKIGEDVVVCPEKNSLISLRSIKANNYLCPFCLQTLNANLEIDSNKNIIDIKSQKGIKSHPISQPRPSYIPKVLFGGLSSAMILCLALAIISILVILNRYNSGTGEINQVNTSTVPTSISSSFTSSNTPSVLKTVPSSTVSPIITSCSGAPPQRVEVGRRGFVCTQYDRLIVREGPSKSEEEITRIFPGTYFRVIDGPVCANNWSWWEIRTDDGIRGWVSEGGDNVDRYFICPQNLGP